MKKLSPWAVPGLVSLTLAITLTSCSPKADQPAANPLVMSNAPAGMAVVSNAAAMPKTGTGEITGIITLKGTPPPEVTNDFIMEDSICGQFYSAPPTTHFYVVGSKGGLGEVIVTLKNTGAVSTGESAGPAVLDQKDCLYTPSILAIQTGQKLVVKNSDPCVHNVHSVSQAGNVPHNDIQAPGDANLTYTFDQPEKFMRFQCDSHQWMFAWVTVVDSPYYAVSDLDGRFTIKNVPPGKYVIEAAHRKLGVQTAGIEVKDNGGATQNFIFEIK